MVFIRPLALILLLLPLSARAQGVYKSEADGFSIRPPSDFREIPIRTGEKWILAKWQSKRTYLWRDETSGFTSEHRPLLRVLCFPKNVKYVTKKEEGDTTVVTADFPYRDYGDYLKRHYQGGGWFVAKEEPLRVDGVDVTYQEINVEKMASEPKVYLVCIYHLVDRELAVEVDILKEDYTKLRSPLLHSLRSLRAFAPDPEAASSSDAKAPGIIVTGGEDLDEKYRERLKAWKERVLAEAAQNLPKGWKKIDTRDYLILTHASPRVTAYFVDQVRAVRRWLDREFEDIGQGEVQKSVIRICADSDEEMAYRSGSNDSYSWQSGEVVVSGGAFIGFENSYLAMSLAEQYFGDKNPALWRALPWWINIGLDNYIGSARVSKIKGFTFDQDVSHVLRARTLVKDKRLIPVQDLMTKSPEEATIGRVEGYEDFATLSSYLVRYLLEGPGRKGPTEDLLVKIMTEAVAVLDGLDKEAWKKAVEAKVVTKTPMTEAEEEEEWKKRQERAKEWEKASAEQRKAFYAGIHARVFAAWSPDDWERLDRSFARYLTTAGR